ncbi:glycogen synthase [Halothermothrix orenii]|uniref:Glycogen synthase n=1 Tax=Halothermothrix orenii (strain H 168 / OCM 544 / DSM 9562) TaxID=373903 RepID=B8D0V3_HALOH|nr:glycogen synthase [Halothermothrix orenii]ACL68922.1 glycogen synthase [Halothermothrix orenii H 168]
MDNLKVTMLTKEYPPYIYGGAGVHVDYLTGALKDIMNVEVRCFGDQEGNKKGIDVTGYHPWEDLSEGSDIRFRKVLDPFSVDLAMVKDPIDSHLVHAHTWYTFMAGFLAKKLYNIPLVTTIHSLEPLRPWKEEQLGRGYQLSLWMEKMGIENSDKVIAVSGEMKKDILKYYDVDEDRVEVIYNGIDLDQYRYTDSDTYRRKYGIDLDKPYVLFVGRITRQKGIIHLVNAIKYINENTQVVLCAGAPDTEEIEKEMTEKVAAIQEKRDGVIWINEMVSKEAVIEFYSNAAVFCCPSVYEPFGIINLEAMACQTPVVASAVGGIKEVVVDGETGFLVNYEQKDEKTGEPKNPEAFSKSLAEKINMVLEDDKLAKEMGKKGRERVEKYFSWESIARQTKKLYESIVQ